MILRSTGKLRNYVGILDQGWREVKGFIVGHKTVLRL